MLVGLWASPVLISWEFVGNAKSLSSLNQKYWGWSLAICSNKPSKWSGACQGLRTIALGPWHLGTQTEDDCNKTLK